MSIKAQTCLFGIILCHFPVIIRPDELEQDYFFRVDLRFYYSNTTLFFTDKISERSFLSSFPHRYMCG